MIIAGTVPMPNHITRIGTSATFGTVLKPISSAYIPSVEQRRGTERDAEQHAEGHRRARTRSAWSVFDRVCAEFSAICCHQSTCSAMSSATGRMKLGIVEQPAPPASQITNRCDDDRSTGRGRRLELRGLAARARAVARARVDVLAQFVHDVLELGLIDDRPCVARPGQVDGPLGDDAARARAHHLARESARKTASRRSWVTRITVERCSHPQVLQHDPQLLAGERVERAERLSSINSSGSWISARQSLARCCMPPESW